MIELAVASYGNVLVAVAVKSVPWNLEFLSNGYCPCASGIVPYDNLHSGIVHLGNGEKGLSLSYGMGNVFSLLSLCCKYEQQYKEQCIYVFVYFHHFIFFKCAEVLDVT